MKNKLAAGLLGIFLGGFGIHKFYLGQTGWGIASLMFCWTGISAVIDVVEGILVIAPSDASFDAKDHSDVALNTIHRRRL